MQLQNFLRPLQKETNRLVKSFLDENPDILKKYVEGGVTAVGLMLTPLNTFMRHLLVVQGLDPDSIPGEKERLALLEALENFFEKRHDKDFDSDYDFSWIQKRFEETRKTLNQLEMTKEKFMDLTDLSKLSSHDKPLDELVAEANPVAPESVKHETRLEIGGDAIDALRKCIQAIEKEVIPSKKKGVKTAKKKLNKGKVGSGTRVRRVTPTFKEQQEQNYVPKQSAIKEALKAKLDTAKKLVGEMVARGLIENNESAKKEQLEQILLMNDEHVRTLTRVITNQIKSPTDKFTGSFRRIQK